MSDAQLYDVCVIGGGINGAGVARDLAGRGLSVLLLEARDLAAATSSASTKLIHGGLRYLEYYEFKLVADALREREVLLKSAPHIIWPLDIVLPHDKNQRPFWLLRLGLFLYDNLGGRQLLKGSKALNFAAHDFGAPLSPRYKKGFSFSDCWVEDSRLVVLNAMDARERGADIKTHAPVTALQRREDIWHITADQSYQARCVVNAAGPWVRQLLDDNDLADSEAPTVRLVKGSHIIVPRQYEGEQAYLLQGEDGRVVFVIPYEHDFTLIGTTDEEFSGDPYAAAISPEETQYLLRVFQAAFDKTIKASDIKSTYSGVRPLLEDGQGSASAVTRDYRIHAIDTINFVSIFGGKLTTYRTLSEKVCDNVCKALKKNAKPWTRGAILPGGDFDDFTEELERFRKKYPHINPQLMRRLIRAYGTHAGMILSNLGEEIGDGLYSGEVDYLRAEEWAKTPEDILWRRSKLGLHVSDDTRQKLEEYLHHG